jgi:hypothetical protein
MDQCAATPQPSKTGLDGGWGILGVLKMLRYFDYAIGSQREPMDFAQDDIY